MAIPSDVACRACQAPVGQPLALSMAFQPIVDLATRSIYAYEALVRGPQGQPAGWVFDQVTRENTYHFDQTCRTTAIRLASRLGLTQKLSINMLPNAVYEPTTCLRATLRAASEVNFPLHQLMFEVTEHEQVLDEGHVRHIIDTYRPYGFTIALDDYGARHANGDLLLAIRPDTLKIDMQVTRGLADDSWRQAWVRHTVAFAREVGMSVIAEGIETVAEARVLHDLGITLMQGYFFARPGFECLPEVPTETFVQCGA